MNAETRTHISTALLAAARWGVAALALVAVVGLVFGTWLFRDYATSNSAAFTLTEAWTPELMAAAVQQLGWSTLTIPALLFGRGIIGFILYMSLGLLLLIRGPRTWFGVFMALTFVAGGYSNYSLRAIAAAAPAISMVTSAIGQFAWQLNFILFYVFPDGHFVPRWTRWLIVPWIVLNLPFVTPFMLTVAGWWLPIPLVLTAIGSQVYRYFWRAGPVERAQTKWIVYTLACLVPLMLAYGFFVPLRADQAPAGGQLASALISTLAWSTVSWAAGMLLPVGIAIAILRYRLFDIDVIIRRTLVYGAVTALLALVFYGSVLLLQQLFTGLTGQASPVAIVASTLAIAALFSPLRRRVQDFVDRRFYRRRYSSVQVLGQFSVIARNETDIDRLTEGLTAAMNETMRPATISMWLTRT